MEIEINGPIVAVHISMWFFILVVAMIGARFAVRHYVDTNTTYIIRGLYYNKAIKLFVRALPIISFFFIKTIKDARMYNYIKELNLQHRKRAIIMIGYRRRNFITRNIFFVFTGEKYNKNGNS